MTDEPSDEQRAQRTPKAETDKSKAARRAKSMTQAAAERAHKRLVQKLDQTRQRAGREPEAAERTLAPAPAWMTSASTTRPDEPVTEDERLLILKLLEEGTITLVQAADLLAALEGNG